MSESKYMLGFTGHRPPKIGGYDPTHPLRIAVYDAMEIHTKSILLQHPGTWIVSGGAQGVDTDATLIARELDIPYIVFAPCWKQEAKWPLEAQKQYAMMCMEAEQVFFATESEYTPTCMQERNRQLVRSSEEMISVWDGSSGGTANCVSYADGQGIKRININPKQLITTTKGEA